MTSGERTWWLRSILAPMAWGIAPLLVIALVLLSSTRSSLRVAEAHGTVDQSQLVSTAGVFCFATGGCGQTFTPTANNIVAFDVNVYPQSALSATFVLRQGIGGPVVAGPFPVTLTTGVNHIDIPGAPIPLTPGNQYVIEDTADLATYMLAADLYPGGTVITGLFGADVMFDLYFATYFLPATATPTQTVTVTRTVTPTLTPTASVTATPTRVPPQRPNVAGAFAGGASGTERNLQRAGVTNDPRAPLQPVPPQPQAVGIAAAQGGSPPAAGMLRPPSTGDAGLVGD